MALLDEILDGPQIVRQEHDTGAINWVRGLSDPGEMIACGYMPSARRQNGESDTAYQERLLEMDLPRILGPARMAQLIAAANRRANLDVRRGKVGLVVAGEPAWHGLGVQLDRHFNGQLGKQHSQTDWEVELMPVQYTFDGSIRSYNPNRVVVRKDTGAALGVVGSRYEPFQNDDLWKFGDDLLGPNGAFYECAGSLDGGRRIFILANLDHAIEPVPDDITDTYLPLTSAHDGSGMIRGVPTGNRVVCANTCRIAMLGGRSKGMGVRHTKSAKSRIRQAAEMMGFAKESVQEFSRVADQLVHKPIPEPRHYFDDVLDAVLDITQAEAKAGSNALVAALDIAEAERELATKSFDRKIKRRGEVLRDILERYESDRCQVPGAQGSSWSAWQAITESVDHGQLGGRYKGSHRERQENRFESVLLGAGDEIKQVALEKALSL